MIKADIFPTAGDMTARTIPAKLSFVHIIRRMTGETILRCAFIYPIYMTACTRNSIMIPRQREAGLAMIEIHILPIRCSMAPGTILSHLAGMNINMTGGTVCWHIFICSVFMAVHAQYSRVFPGQGKNRLGMIKCNILPFRRSMAEAAIRP